MDDGDAGLGVRSRYSCDLCRLRRKKCSRSTPTAKCDQCERYGYPCSPSRTLGDLLDVLYGRDGLLRHDRRSSAGLDSQPDLLVPESQAYASPNQALNSEASYASFVDPTNYPATDAFEFDELPSSADLDLNNFSSTDNAVQSDGNTALQLFNQYASLNIIFIDITRHLAVLDSQRLQASYPYVYLSSTAESIKRKMCNIFGKIEELGYEADASQNDDRAQWIYQRAIRALDHCTNYPDDRRRSLLLKIARFYQRLDSHLEAEHVLEKVAKIRNMSINVTSSEKEFRDVRSSSIEQISRALIAAFAELPKHELPPALSSDPSPSLHRALQHDSPKLVSALLVAGRGPLPPCDIMDQTILHVAAQNGHADLLEQIIRKYPSININCRDLCQRTPLFLAASNGHDRVCKLLLNLHADKDARNLASHTVFEVAARNGHLGVVRLLCDRQANVNPLPFDGTSTPLQAAAESGHIDIVRVLLATGKIDLSLKRLPDQKTAKDLACDRGFTEISNLLTSTSRSTRCETNEFFGTHSFRY